MNTTINPTFETYVLSFPAEDMKLVKDLVKKFGWKLRRKKTGMQEAMDDVKHGRVSDITDIDAYFKKLGVE